MRSQIGVFVLGLHACRPVRREVDGEGNARLDEKFCAPCYPILPIGPGEVFLALDIRARYSISDWDSLVVAAAQTILIAKPFQEDLRR
jgi:predicted nucleic acid-binding protein